MLIFMGNEMYVNYAMYSSYGLEARCDLDDLTENFVQTE